MKISQVDSNVKYKNLFDTKDIKNDLKGKTVRGGIWTLVGQFGSYAIRLISTVVLARLLSPADYGLIAMVAVVTNFIGIFSDMGLSMSTVQQKNITHEQVSNLFWINLFVTSLLGIVLACSAPLVSAFYQDERILRITLWSAITFPLAGLSLQHLAILKRQMRFAAIAQIKLVSMALSVIAALIAAYLGMGYWSLIVLNITMVVCTTPMAWLITGWMPGWFTRNQGTRSHLSFGGYLTGSNVAGYLFRNVDRVLIGKFCSALELGLYDRAYQLLMLPLSQFIYPLSSLAMPVLSRLQDDPARYRRVYIEMQEKMCFLVAPGIGIVLAYNDIIIELMLGEQWLEVSPIFLWLSFIGIVQASLGLVSSLFISQGRVKEHLWWQIFTSVMATISFVIGLPWGALGVAISFALSGLFLRIPLFIWWAGRKGHVTAVDIASSVAVYTVYGLGTALVFSIFRPIIHQADNYIITVLIIMVSLLVSYAGYWIFPRTRTIANDLVKYRSFITQKKS